MAALCAAPACAASEEYLVRHDLKLESMILRRVAAKIGDTRGALEREWRTPTAIDRLAALSLPDLAILGGRFALHEEPPEPVARQRAQPRMPFVKVTSSAGVQHIASTATP